MQLVICAPKFTVAHWYFLDIWMSQSWQVSSEMLIPLKPAVAFLDSIWIGRRGWPHMHCRLDSGPRIAETPWKVDGLIDCHQLNILWYAFLWPLSSKWGMQLPVIRPGIISHFQWTSQELSVHFLLFINSRFLSKTLFPPGQKPHCEEKEELLFFLTMTLHIITVFLEDLFPQLSSLFNPCLLSC